MQIKRFLKFLIVSVLCIFCVCGSIYAAGNEPLGDIDEYGSWINADNAEKYKTNVSNDIEKFQGNFTTNLTASNFVPLEVKLGLVFMKSLNAIDKIMQMSLVRFTIILLLISYAVWIGLEAYKLIRDSGDYKTVIYEIFKKGMIISMWLIVLDYGPARLFGMLASPIIELGRYLSDFILSSVSETYHVEIPDTCAAVHTYVAAHNTGALLIDTDAAANIMCLPARMSVFFYHATAQGFKWMGYGITHSLTAFVVGGVSVYIFIKCIFKYALMTLGIIADLFLTLLMLPFTAIAEAMPELKESNYIGQIFSGLLKIFNAKKISNVISTFINTCLYFASISIIIALSAILLSKIISVDAENSYTTAYGIESLLTGALILYLINRTDEYASKLGGKIDNALGKQLTGDTKTLMNKTKDIASMIYKDWLKKK